MRGVISLVCLALLACEAAPISLQPVDAASAPDRAEDDAASADGGLGLDAAPLDADAEDAAPEDADALDTGAADAPFADTSFPDAATRDAAPLDAAIGGGPYPITSASGSVRRGNRRTAFVRYLPATPSPPPAVFFVPGFQLESERYAPLLEALAASGVAVIRADPPDPLLGVNHVEMAEDLRAVIGEVLANHPVDGTRVGVMGHSLGGKIAAMTAFRDARVGALLGLDPVNGGAPGIGFSAALPDIVPDEIAPLRIPVGFLGETTNGMGGGLSPACAPLDQNFATFYDAATNAPWAASWELAGADHMDFVEDTSRCLVCGACPDGPADDATVRAATRSLTVAFFALHLLGDASAAATLTGASVPAIATARSRP